MQKNSWDFIIADLSPANCIAQTLDGARNIEDQEKDCAARFEKHSTSAMFSFCLPQLKFSII